MEERQIEQLIEKYGFELIQTHISWVLLGDSVVYKIKKPVDFGFLDYTTLSRRKVFCEKEIELNRRLAEEIYLGVSNVVRKGNNLFIDEEGEVIDYAVKMVRMPQERMMDVLIKNNQVTYAYIDALAKKVAIFHRKAKTNSYIAKFGSIEVNRTNTDENFQQTEDAIGEYITAYEYDSIKNYTNDFYERKGELFNKRIEDGKVKDCHGDMYSRNVCILDDEHIYVYDCIEFNERFRYSDIASDVAFMLMDLENYGMYDLSERFLISYVKFSSDRDLLEIIDFYKIYRAYVRGKIAFFQKQKREANLYFDLAFGYLPESFKPKVIVMSGLTGAGKSVLSQRLAKYGFEVLVSDVIRKSLSGMNVLDKDLSSFGGGIYSSDMTQRVYKMLIDRAYALVREGKNVILDATFLRKSQRDMVFNKLRRLGIEPLVVFIEMNDETAREHFRKRDILKSVSDGRWEIYIRQKELLEKPYSGLILSAKDSVEVNVKKVMRVLGGVR